MIQNTTDFKTFNYQENGSIHFSILATKFSTNKLKSGVYDLKSIYKSGDTINELNESVNDEKFDNDVPYGFKDRIDAIFNNFYCKECKAKVNLLGYNHKVGLLLYGKQGTGKTSILKSYFTRAIEEESAIVFNITSLEYFYKTWEFIKAIRKIQDNPIVVFMDEFEDIFEKYKSEDIIKRAMDGFDSIDNCFFMMTTNYIDKVPETIRERVSRVKYCIEVEGLQEEIVIENFLRDSFNKIGSDYDFSKDIKTLKGGTLDDIKQFVVDKIMNIETNYKKTSKIGF